MDRCLRKVRLTCASADEAQQGRILLEDALRTASLGDEGRLIIVRRLDLGKLPPRTSAMQWSLRLEERFRQAHPGAVWCDSPAAAHAAVVVFPSRIDAWLLLAGRVAAHQPCLEWFWRGAVPEWRTSDSVESTLRLCFRTLARLGGLPVTFALASRLDACGRLPLLLRSLKPEDFDPIRSELGPEAPVTAVTGAPTDTAQTLSMATTLAGGNIRGSATVPARWLRRLPRSHASPCPAGTLASPLPAAGREQVTFGQPSARTAPPPTARGATAAPARDRATDDPDMTPLPVGPWLPDRVYTAGGGLFFVIPLLVHAQFPTYLMTLSPKARLDLPWQLLKVILRHGRIPDDDPLTTALPILPPVSAGLGRWILTAHRTCRRLTGLSLRQLVARPALLGRSLNHFDFFFRTGDADIRIRRAALDIDPGWVPWLGRFIGYHFNLSD